MKKIKIFLALLLLCTSCNYLDIIPDNIASLDYAFKDRVRAEQYLFTLYSYMPRHGLPQYPGRFDDFMWSHPGVVSSRNQLGYDILTYGNNVTSPTLNYWDGLNGATGLWKGIRDCNIFIERLHEVRDLEAYEKAIWIAEAKFLKAYYHYFLFQMYGPIPIVDVNLPITATKEETMVFREPADEVIDYIVRTLEDAAKDLAMWRTNEVAEMGRITRPIALAMRAKVLMTGASPQYNGNTDYKSFIDKRGKKLINDVYDAAKWERAVKACKEAIDTCHAAGHKLYTYTNQARVLTDDTRLILQTSQIVTDKWNVEHIWGTGHYSNSYSNARYTLPPFQTSHQEFAFSFTVPTLKAVESFYTINGVPIEEDKYWDYEGRYSLVQTTADQSPFVQSDKITAKLHLDREYRFYGSIGFDGGWWYGLGQYDENNQWPIKAKMGETSGPKGIERFSVTAFFIKKLSNFESAYSGASFVEKKWDFPIIRLADLYLLYAEALNEMKTEPDAEVYEYLDKVRERAGLEGVVKAWADHSKYPQKPLAQDGMRNIIRRERAIELVFEEQRFWDVKRWGIAEENLDGAVSGWNYTGMDDTDFYRIRVVQNIDFRQKDVYWPIRQYNISVNPNLIQNPGW